MIEHATNLLPENMQQAYAKRYLMRVAIVAVYTLGILLVIHAILLIPTYLFFVEDIRQKESSLTYLQEYQKVDEAPDTEVRAQALEENAARLLPLAGSAKATHALLVVNKARVPGILLESISFSKDTATERVAIRGNAKDRATLESFRKALVQSAGVTAVDLPVGAFAQDKDISFDLIVSGRFTTLPL